MFVGKTPSVIFWVDLILFIILLWIVINQIVIFIRSRRAAKLVDNQELKNAMHHAQIIDVREEDAFKNGHILGARNIDRKSVV